MLRFIIFAGCLAGSILPAVAQPSTAPLTACGGETAGAVTVASVSDGRTFRAADGREVRLAGIEAPGSKAALDALIAGKSITLTRAGSGEDRYGRVVAFGQVADISIQLELLRDGAAYVAARVGSKPCADALFAAEKIAREARLGLWANPELGPKSAANRDEIARLNGQFAVVEGLVLGVRESGGAVYLNFGTYYTRDFSVLVLKRNVARLAPHRLDGKRIRVRGVVEMRRGPFIEAARPEQIELIE